MASLTNTEIKLIKSCGGLPLDDEFRTIRFDKVSSKPSRECKKLLTGKGYKISNKSGANFFPYMDYVLTEESENA